MKKVMIIGRSGSGKTTLIHNILYGKSNAKKTQSIERLHNLIDTPGEYIENPRLYRAILLTSYDVDSVVLVIDSEEDSSIFPPEFASAFNREVIGVVTKIDKKKEFCRAVEFLKKAGVKKIYYTSSKDLTTIEELKNYLLEEGV